MHFPTDTCYREKREIYVNYLLGRRRCTNNIFFFSAPLWCLSSGDCDQFISQANYFVWSGGDHSEGTCVRYLRLAHENSEEPCQEKSHCMFSLMTLSAGVVLCELRMTTVFAAALVLRGKGALRRRSHGNEADRLGCVFLHVSCPFFLPALHSWGSSAFSLSFNRRYGFLPDTTWVSRAVVHVTPVAPRVTARARTW